MLSDNCFKNLHIYLSKYYGLKKANKNTGPAQYWVVRYVYYSKKNQKSKLLTITIVFFETLSNFLTNEILSKL